MKTMNYDLFLRHRKSDSQLRRIDLGCGMALFIDRGSSRRVLVNTSAREVFELTASDGRITAFSPRDVADSRYSGRSCLDALYYFGVEPFIDGVALVTWTITPDGIYFMDEDGFGMEDTIEENLYAFIDTRCRVLVPFQTMTPGQIPRFREQARTALLEK
ncbi:MAG: hypothetical protein J6K95_02010 [Rikenellaceae bacterium]|nr:hypothetical protein [Rikenellaceae bacterium]